MGIKPTVGLTSRAGVIPESEHQDSVGCLGKNVRDATYCLDAMYGPDSRDNYTLAQVDRTPEKGYAQFLADKDALKNATFGIPWNSFWVHADDEQLRVLLDMIKVIEEAGATIVNHTELLDYEKIVSPDGWNWDYGQPPSSPIKTSLLTRDNIRHNPRPPQRIRIHRHQSRLLQQHQNLPLHPHQHPHPLPRRHLSLQLRQRRHRGRSSLAFGSSRFLLRPRRLPRESRHERRAG